VVRHVGVDDDRGVVGRLQLADRVPAVRRAIAVETLLEIPADGGVVFDDQDLFVSTHDLNVVIAAESWQARP
jgi:hypothetical protein